MYGTSLLWFIVLCVAILALAFNVIRTPSGVRLAPAQATNGNGYYLDEMTMRAGDVCYRSSRLRAGSGYAFAGVLPVGDDEPVRVLYWKRQIGNGTAVHA